MRWFFLLIVVAVVIALPLSAQDGNLLLQPGFDDGYTGRGRADLNIPGAWGLWTTDVPRSFDYQNRSDKMFAFPHNAAPEKRSGASSLNLSGGFVTFTAAVYQQVNVPVGTNLTGSAYAWLHTCNLPKNSAGEFTASACGSAVESGALTKVGIDPNGGTNPLDADVIWSAEARPHDRFDQMVVNATATGPTVTLFLYVTQVSPSDLNNVYWDDASLTVGGPGGTSPASAPAATLVPTARPFVPVPVKQQPGSDGALVHIIQAGDTVDSLAYVYGTTRQAILDLNPDLIEPGFIRIGDRLVIRLAPEATEESTAESTAESTLEPGSTLFPPVRGTPGPTPTAQG